VTTLTDAELTSEQRQALVNAEQLAGMGDGVERELALVGVPVASVLLEDVETFLARFVAYPSEAARVAHVLWIAHTWFMDEWDSTPRVAFLSPEPGSGKSRALEVTEPLVPRPVHAVNATPAYLFRKVSDEDGRPTILYDEIDTVFGPRAKDNEDVRGMLNAGHRKGAMAGRAAMRGKTVVTEELPAYCAVALAGLDDLPDTIMTRSVVIRMRRRAPHEHVEPWRMRTNGAEGHELGDRLREWAEDAREAITWPDMPAGIEDRNADVWEALLAVADLAGGQWPKRAREAALALVAASSDRGGSLGVVLLRDLRGIFANAERLTTERILEQLRDLDESPWADLRGKPLDSRGLARRLAKYGVKPTQYRDEHGKQRGYLAADLADPWSRYLPCGTAEAQPVQAERAVPAVPDVPAISGPGRDDVPTSTDPLWESPHRREDSQNNAPHLSLDSAGTSGTGGTGSAGLTLLALPGRCPEGYAANQHPDLCDCTQSPTRHRQENHA
jgi:hypothetical protein